MDGYAIRGIPSRGVLDYQCTLLDMEDGAHRRSVQVVSLGLLIDEAFQAFVLAKFEVPAE